MRIHLLPDRPDAIPVLASAFTDDWGPYYGPHGPGDAVRDLRACLNRDGLPMAWVAEDDGGVPLGTASLKADSLGGDQFPGPWLAAFLVLPAHRRRGVGTALVATVETAARDGGFDALYTSTDTFAGALAGRGWRTVGQVGSLRGTVAVMELRLDAGTGRPRPDAGRP